MEDQLWGATRDRVFTDVEFIIGEEIMAAHRPIIAARCPILAATIDAADQPVDPSEQVDTSNRLITIFWGSTKFPTFLECYEVFFF